MYETSKVSFSMRYKECLYEGISCKTSKNLGDIQLTFQFADKDIWALEVTPIFIFIWHCALFLKHRPYKSLNYSFCYYILVKKWVLDIYKWWYFTGKCKGFVCLWCNHWIQSARGIYTDIRKFSFLFIIPTYYQSLSIIKHSHFQKVYAEEINQNNEDDLLSLLPKKLATERVNIGSFELVVIKTNRTLNKIFTAVLMVLVLLNTINMGA